MGLLMELLERAETGMAPDLGLSRAGQGEPQTARNDVETTTSPRRDGGAPAWETIPLAPRVEKPSRPSRDTSETSSAQEETPAASATPPSEAMPDTARRAAESPSHARWGARTVYMADTAPSAERRVVVRTLIGVAGVAALLLGFRAFEASRGEGPVALAAPPVSAPVEAAIEKRVAEPVPLEDMPAKEPRAEPASAVAATKLQPPATTLHVKRSITAPGADRLAAEGYARYQAGDTAAARLAYEKALATEPDHRDALLGLAAVAVTEGRRAKARDLYLRLLARDPHDALAAAGWLGVDPPANAQARESRLMDLLVSSPGSAHIHAALGHLYASERRWAAAQQAYAQAAALAGREGAPTNPDFAFNLAVSLDRLGRTSAALERYREALDQSKRHRPTFDPAVAEARVRALAGG